MIVHVLVEGRSESAFIDAWAGRAFPGHEFRPHPHEGKGSLPRKNARPDPRRKGLLDLLPATLRAYGETRTASDYAVVVLVDADEENCLVLKKRLVAMAKEVRPRPQRLLFRIAVEETEAYYLGDLKALKAAFPQADMTRARRYKPDSIVGTAELFGEIVDDGGLNKVAWAHEMGARLTTDAATSRSESFRALVTGITKLVAPRSTPAPKRKKHWKSRFSAKRKAAERR